MKDLTGRIVARLPIEVATFLLNEKREDVFDIEKRTGVQIILVPDPSMTLPNYEVERVREEDQRHDAARDVSYELTAEVDATSTFSMGATAQADEPAVKAVPLPAPPPSRPAPSAEPTGRTGLLVRLRTWLFGERPEPGRVAARPQAPSRQGRHGARRNSTERGRGDGSESRRRGGAPRRTENRSHHGQGHGESRRRGGQRATQAAVERETASARDSAPPEESTLSGGETSPRGTRRGSRRGRRGGSRARGRDGARAASGGAEGSARAPETGPSGGADRPAAPVESETGAPARTESPRAPAPDAAPECRRSGVEAETGAAAPAQSGSQADPTGDSGVSEPAGRPAPKKSRGRGRTDARPNPDSLSKADAPSAGDAGEPPPKETESSAEPAGN